jgi:hypothetical protein
MGGWGCGGGCGESGIIRRVGFPGGWRKFTPLNFGVIIVKYDFALFEIY